MEGNKKDWAYRLKWITNIVKHGLFLHGVRNNLAKIGIDIMPYYWVQEALEPITAPEIRGEDKNFTIVRFGEEEIEFVKNTIIGIDQKDLLTDLKNGEICLGLKNHGKIAAYMFIKRKSFVFRKRKFKLNSDESYLHSMYTFEDYRGKNLAPYLRFQSYNFLRKEGVNTYNSVSEYFNKSTIRFKEKLQSKPLKLYLSILLFKRWTFNFTLKTFK